MKRRFLALLLTGMIAFTNQGVVYAAQTQEYEQVEPQVVQVQDLSWETENPNEVSQNELDSKDDMAADQEETVSSEVSDEETDIETAESDDLINSDWTYRGNGHFDIELELPEGETDVEVPTVKRLARAAYPAKYRSDRVDTDGDGVADANYLPALRNQGSYDTCWAFSSIGACEAGLIKQGLANNAIDLSEKHLAYYLYMKPDTVGDMMGNTIGDYNRMDSKAYYASGGNVYYALWHLASGAGLVSESKNNAFAYSTITNSAIMKNTASEIYGQNDYLLQNAYVISFNNGVNNAGTIAKVKEYIMQYGAVAASYYDVHVNAGSYDSGAAGKNTGDEGCYYYYPSESNINIKTNHAVQLVGWDDSYDKNKFATTPDGDGAWLVKNSWGEESDQLAQDGYFWLSYYDKGLNSANSRIFAFDCSRADEYDHIYQYDGASNVMTTSNLSEAANIFQASSTSPYERIDAVSIGSYSAANYTIKIYIFENGKYSGTDFTTEEPSYSQRGSIPCDGYHTIKLDEPVYVKHGQKFAVLFSFDKKVYLYADKTTSDTYYSHTEQSSGQSFIKTSSGWVDSETYGETNRIKAFTSDCSGIAISAIELSQSSLALNKGDSAVLTATVLPSDTTESKTVTWKSSNTSVATVTSGGEVTAVGAGNATITATCGGKSAACEVTVKVPVIGSVSLNKSTVTLEKGDSTTLTATVLPLDPTESKTVTWKSSNTLVATVTSGGEVTAVGAGNAIITATCDGKSAACEVTVKVPVSSVSLDKSTVTLEKGGSTTLTATVLPSDTTESKTVTWESSKTSVATVTSSGEVTAVGAGSATITATCGGKSADCTVTVKVPVSSVSLDKNTVTLEKGGSTTITATVLPTDTTEARP